ncbi:ATP-binding protein [Kitasatospora terrestris]|uniref:LuxR family transcriptional regulator n=1 Tax=Kitasatospora terrestris TaxID=258051 RepID=A0ABP9DEN9_9ACTN
MRDASAPGPAADRRTGLAFVGRADELRSLLDALRAGPAVVFVEGEAGIGKSRLLREAADRLDRLGPPVLRGWCHPLREPLPFGPALDALRGAGAHLPAEVRLSPATGVLAPYLPELADRLPRTAPEGGTRNQQLMRAVHEVLRALGPVVLVVEDLHWADDATRDLLLLLARNPPEGLRLVVTYRERELPGSGNVLGSPYRRPLGVGGTDLALDPLGETHIGELAASVLGPAATRPLCRELYERSGGLPLAAEEDILVLADRVARPDEAGAPLALAGAKVPRALQEAVNSRVAPLGPGSTAVLQAAAVLAVPTTEELLTAVAALTEDQAEQALDAVLTADLLVEHSPGRYGFRHVLARRAVYDRIPGPRRRRLHTRAADALSAQREPALVQIAHHVRQLGDTAAWFPHALAAAERATAVADDGVAAELLGQLLGEPSLPSEDRTRAALALSAIAVRRTDPAACEATLRGIIADPALAPSVRGEIRFNLARAVGASGPYRDTRAELERAIAELADRPGHAAAATASLAVGATVNARGGTVSENLALLERAAELAARSDDPVARADVLANRVTLLAFVGDPRRLDLLARLPLDSTDRAVLRQCARALSNTAYLAGPRGSTAEAAARLAEAQELIRRTDYPLLDEFCRLNRIRLDLAAGHWDGLDRTIDTMLRETTEGTLRFGLLTARATLDTARGRWAAAREGMAPLVTDLDGNPDLDVVPAAVTVLARLDLLEGDPATAWQRTGPVVEVLGRKGLWVRPVDLVPTAVEAALACGLDDRAHRLVEDAARGVDGLDAPGVATGVHLARALLAADSDPEAALAHLDRAHAGYQAAGHVHSAAGVLERSGRLRLRTTPDTATADLHAALDVFTRLGATADAARCERALRDSGRLRPPARRKRAYGGELSPRERQVAALLADGASNQDIARTLALSPRTAEHHVANTLRKLGVPRGRVREVLDPPR